MPGGGGRSLSGGGISSGGRPGGSQPGGGRPGGSQPGGGRPGGGVPGGAPPAGGPGRGQPGGGDNNVPRGGPQSGGNVNNSPRFSSDNRPGGNRSPSFTQPNPGSRPGLGSNFNQRGGPDNQRPDGIRNDSNDRGNRNDRGNGGGNEGRNRFPDGNVVNRPGGNQRPGSNVPGDRDRFPNNNWDRRDNQWAGGNTININNRPIRLSNNSYRPSYSRHPQYRGSWNGNYGGGNGGFGRGFGTGLGFGLGYGLASGYGGYGWGGPGFGGYGYRPIGWGLGGWGLGSLAYGSGYLGYSNPYYLETYAPIGNYAYTQPIPVYYQGATIEGATPVDGNIVADPNTLVENRIVDGQSATAGTTACEQAFDEAVTAFKQNNHDAALDIVNRGLVSCPDDSVMHEFRALILFAKADYQQAASTIHSVLAVGPGWNWTTLSSLYSDVATYTTHLRALEAFTRQYPQDAAAKFLLAYHYIADGYPDSAVPQLKQVVNLVPSDRVAADILRMLEKPAQSSTTDGTPLPTPEPPEVGAKTDSLPADPAVPPLNPEKLLGTWNATRDDGSKFELTISPEGKFHWKYTVKETVQEFDGTYTIEGNVIALERKDGGSLIAGIVPTDDSQFNFKLIGAPKEDPGLNFSR